VNLARNPEGPALSSSHLPAWLSSAFARFAGKLGPRTAARVPLLLLGCLFARGRRTVTSWFRAGGITAEFRPAYHAAHSIGRRCQRLALAALDTAEPCLAGWRRLLVGLDDSPTARYGPRVRGAGLHHNPTPGPAGEEYLYGHVWVRLAALARHPRRGTIALPLLGSLYVGQKDVPGLPAEYQGAFHTKLELAAAQLHWLKLWAGRSFEELVAVVDGGYAKRPFLEPAKQAGFEVISRLRQDAAWWGVPEAPPPGRPGRRPVYGKKRISLAKRAGLSGPPNPGRIRELAERLLALAV
jgi:hypothetical protein